MFQIHITNAVELYKKPQSPNPEKVIPAGSYLNLISAEDVSDGVTAYCCYEVEYISLGIADRFFIRLWWGGIKGELK